MSVYFSSDWHLGSNSMATIHRGFKSIEEHDNTIIERMNSIVTKRDKLFILGDVAFNKRGLNKLNDLNCRVIEIILGNHDYEPMHSYIGVGVKLHGFKKYKKYWLSHCPIHPNELYRSKGNIHGHVHATGNSKEILEPGYFNVNVDVNDYYPVAFETIQAAVCLEIEVDI